MDTKSILIELVKNLPTKPGVYQFFNHSGDIIYVGKAKDLRKRVSSYLSGSEVKSYKQEALVKKISDIRYIIVDNESDALLLENNLIKEYQPKYNILLKDDKTFPWISIKSESFARVMVTRNYIMDGTEYFGPYTSGIMMKTLLELIRQLYKIRTCNLTLSNENILKKKFKRCLEFHMGNCKAPCEGLQDEAEHNQNIAQIREILKGNLQHVMKHLHKLMSDYSRSLRFEEAEIIRRKLEILERFKGKSTIVNPKISQIDVFSIIDGEEAAYVNFLKVVNGAIIQAHNVEVVKRLDEPAPEILAKVIFNLRNRFNSDSKEIVVPCKPDMVLDQVRFCIPLKGDKKNLLDLSLRNAASFRFDRQNKNLEDKRADQESKVLLQLKDDLRLKSLPVFIECFDNSNIQGSNPVASCVVFKNGRPFKSAYRHFNIKTVTGADDFASMEEIVYRRYKRLIEEQDRLPDLVIIDGGKGQLNAAVNSMKKLEIYGSISIVGIAKRLEEIYVPEDPIPLYLNKNSISLRLIQRIRDEAHRFGLAFHKKKRSDSQLQSFFDKIPGIGSKTKEKILSKESDVQKLQGMSIEELEMLTDKRTARILNDYFTKIKTP